MFYTLHSAFVTIYMISRIIFPMTNISTNFNYLKVKSFPIVKLWQDVSVKTKAKM